MKSIQANPISVNDVFNTREFIIPDFQRPYSWEKDQCLRLWDDIVSFFDESKSSAQTYFLGNIVVYPDFASGGRVWTIIDGQQRLTTLMLLMRAILEQPGSEKFSFLENRIHKVDQNTDRPIKNDIRLVSKVLPDSGDDYENLKKVMLKGSRAHFDSPNLFGSNYKELLEDLTAWWSSSTEKAREDFITFFRERLKLLPIECESEDDALTLFETINDRGMPLSDADIFKAKIFQAVPSTEKQDFISRWNNLENHVDLFKVHMYILKAEEKDSKRSKLKNYIIKECFENKGLPPLRGRWNSVMRSLELYHHFSTEGLNWANDEISHNKETIYRAILSQHPNDNWQYPMYAFIRKHAKFSRGKLSLTKDKKREYLALLKSSVRFFFAKGLVYNSIEAVRGVSHKVAVSIMEGCDQPSYASEVTKKELDLLEIKLKEPPDYGRYKKGLVFLSAFLNNNQQKDAGTTDYAGVLRGDVKIEYILPKKPGNYPEWDDETFQKSIEKLGNLMPIEASKIAGAANDAFNEKQKIYSTSKVQDAQELSEKKISWNKKSLNKRHQESLERLLKFFRSTSTKA